MSKPTACFETACNYCEHYDKCTRHICDYCGRCEGTIYSFGDTDFDLCSDCLVFLQNEITKGLTKIDQGQINKNLPEKLTVIRKTISEDTRNAIFARNNWKCCQCGSTKNLEIDHIKPFSKGGTTDPSNLQTLCKKCNREKWAN